MKNNNPNDTSVDTARKNQTARLNGLRRLVASVVAAGTLVSFAGCNHNDTTHPDVTTSTDSYVQIQLSDSDSLSEIDVKNLSREHLETLAAELESLGCKMSVEELEAINDFCNSRPTDKKNYNKGINNLIDFYCKNYGKPEADTLMDTMFGANTSVFHDTCEKYGSGKADEISVYNRAKLGIEKKDSTQEEEKQLIIDFSSAIRNTFEGDKIDAGEKFTHMNHSYDAHAGYTSAIIMGYVRVRLGILTLEELGLDDVYFDCPWKEVEEPKHTTTAGTTAETTSPTIGTTWTGTTTTCPPTKNSKTSTWATSNDTTTIRPATTSILTQTTSRTTKATTASTASTAGTTKATEPAPNPGEFEEYFDDVMPPDSIVMFKGLFANRFSNLSAKALKEVSCVIYETTYDTLNELGIENPTVEDMAYNVVSVLSQLLLTDDIYNQASRDLYAASNGSYDKSTTTANIEQSAKYDTSALEQSHKYNLRDVKYLTNHGRHI